MNGSTINKDRKCLKKNRFDMKLVSSVLHIEFEKPVEYKGRVDFHTFGNKELEFWEQWELKISLEIFNMLQHEFGPSTELLLGNRETEFLLVLRR